MTDIKPLHFNDIAPDLELSSSTGRQIRLSDLWSEKTLLLAFIRHFGCPQCKEMLFELEQYRPNLDKVRITLAVVTQGTPAETQSFCDQYAPTLLCLSDPDRAAYQAYGLGLGSLRQTVLSPRIWRANRLVKQRQGWKPELPPSGQDAFQMSGIFIIGTDGRVRLPYYYEDIADHPPLDLLMYGVMGKDWSSPFEGPILKNPGETLSQS